MITDFSVTLQDCLSGAIEHSDAPSVVCPYKDDKYSCEMKLLEREIKAVRKYLTSDITHFIGYLLL